MDDHVDKNDALKVGGPANVPFSMVVTCRCYDRAMVKIDQSDLASAEMREAALNLVVTARHLIQTRIKLHMVAVEVDRPLVAEHLLEMTYFNAWLALRGGWGNYPADGAQRLGQMLTTSEVPRG